jgi:hypothetical protein
MEEMQLKQVDLVKEWVERAGFRKSLTKREN